MALRLRSGVRAKRPVLHSRHALALVLPGLGPSPEKKPWPARWRQATRRSSPGRWSGMCRGCGSRARASSKKACQAGRGAARGSRTTSTHQGAHRRAEPQDRPNAARRRPRVAGRAARRACGRRRHLRRTIPSRWSAPTSSACAAYSSCTTSRTRSATFRPRAPQHDGLTELGLKVVHECNRLGILVDLAHCTDAAMAQALAASNTASRVVAQLGDTHPHAELEDAGLAGAAAFASTRRSSSPTRAVSSVCGRCART